MHLLKYGEKDGNERYVRLETQLDLEGSLIADIAKVGKLCTTLLDNRKENQKMTDTLKEELEIVMEVRCPQSEFEVAQNGFCNIFFKVWMAGHKFGDGDNWLRELLGKCRHRRDLENLGYEELDNILRKGATPDQRAAVEQLFAKGNNLRKGALDAKVDLRVADELADQVSFLQRATIMNQYNVQGGRSRRGPRFGDCFGDKFLSGILLAWAA